MINWKANLVKRGIPADEVRFVQDANNDAEKKALFDAVNDGEIRVLIGSTQRMGAGTNVQRLLVALHHGDVTWKPSDIEQREGRIKRQGNKLLAKYGDKFKVDILAYVTERTIDAKMWDLNATKLKMINGIRSYDGSFNMDFDDEYTVGMAEIAALASGDPIQLERVKLAAEISKLELLERAHRRKQYGLADQIAQAKDVIANHPRRIKEASDQATVLSDAYAVVEKAAAARSVDVEGKPYGSDFDAMSAAVAAIKSQQAGDDNAKYNVSVDGKRFSNKSLIEEAIKERLGDDRPFEMTMGGKPVITRSAASKAIAAAANQMAAKVKTQDDIEKRTIGQMFGHDVEVEVTPSFGGGHILSMYLSRGGKTIAAGETLPTVPGKEFSQQGGRAALDRLLTDIGEKAGNRGQRMRAQLEEVGQELPALEAEAKAPFAQAKQIADKRDRLKAVIGELAARTEADEKRGAAPPAAPMSVAMAAPAATLPSGLYSAVERVVAETPRMDKARADQWMGLLRNKPGVKPEELRWLGLAEWLGAHPGAVTRTQLLDYIRANQIQINEVTKNGGAPVTEAHLQAARDWINANALDDLNGRDPEDIVEELRVRDRRAIGDMEALGAPNEVLAPFYGEAMLSTDIDDWEAGETRPLEDGSGTTTSPLTLPGVAEAGTGVDVYHDKDGEVTGYGVFYRGTLMAEATNFASAVHELQGHMVEDRRQHGTSPNTNCRAARTTRRCCSRCR